MASNHSLYKNPSKMAVATPLQKSMSKYERKIRAKKIEIFKLLAQAVANNDQKKHQAELIKIIRRKDEMFVQECLEEKEKSMGKKLSGMKVKLDYMKSQYRVDGTSQIRGWIKKQIDKYDANVATGEGGRK